MTRRTITGALAALGLVAASIAPAAAQAPTTVIVPAPSASPSTVVTPGPAGTTVVVPPGSTVTVTPPPATLAAVAVQPWCAGNYALGGGTNFGGCPGYLPR
jgi:hypothetical protein